MLIMLKMYIFAWNLFILCQNSIIMLGYHLIRFTRIDDGSKHRPSDISVVARKVTGSVIELVVKYSVLRKCFGSEFSLGPFKSIYVLIRQTDSSPHYWIVKSVSSFVLFSDQEYCLKYIPLQLSISKIVLSCVYDKDSLSTMQSVLKFLHDDPLGGKCPPRVVNRLPL